LEDAMNDHILPRKLSVGIWLSIDGALDNAVADLVRGGTDPDVPEVARARGLRERGWAVSREHPDRQFGVLDWPPREARFDIALSDDDVGYIAGLLAHDLGVTASILASEVSPSIRRLQEEALVLTQEALDALNAFR
jgi:hypothetical protein